MNQLLQLDTLNVFAADYERESGQISLPEISSSNGIKIAVVGSGPAGLSFAGDMIKRDMTYMYLKLYMK